MTRRLVVRKEGEVHLAFPVGRPVTTIGRAPDNFIQLPDQQISKHHAIIEQGGDEWHIRDLDSRNGLSVNGSRVARAPIRHGDTIAIGPYEFAFETVAAEDDWAPDRTSALSNKAQEVTLSRLIRGSRADDTICEA